MTQALCIGDAVAAAEAFTDSHCAYPAFRSVFPDQVRRARALRSFFLATVRDGCRAGEVAGVVEHGVVLGAAVWLPPGQFPWSAARKLAAMPSLARVATAYPSRWRTFLRYGTAAERAHPRDEHWYLVALGVRHRVQRLGLGRQLLADGLRRADSDGVACCLETSDPTNVAFYRRFGFEVINDDLPLVAGGPSHVAMRRPAPA